MASYKKGVTLTLGLLNLSVDLYPAIKDKEEKSGLKRLCTEHKTPVGNEHVCRRTEEVEGKATEVTHSVAYGTWFLAGQDDEGHTRLVHEKDRPSPEATSELRMVPVPTTELESNTLEGTSIFYCKPSSDAETALETWTLFRRGVEQSKTSLVTKGVLRKGVREKLYRLTSFNGYLVLRELYFPASISEPPQEPPAIKTTREHQDLFKQLIEMTSNDFASLDPENKYKSDLIVWLKTGQILEVEEVEKPQNPGDMLQKMVAEIAKGKN